MACRLFSSGFQGFRLILLIDFFNLWAKWHRISQHLFVCKRYPRTSWRKTSFQIAVAHCLTWFIWWYKDVETLSVLLALCKGNLRSHVVSIAMDQGYQAFMFSLALVFRNWYILKTIEVPVIWDAMTPICCHPNICLRLFAKRLASCSISDLSHNIPRATFTNMGLL